MEHVELSLTSEAKPERLAELTSDLVNDLQRERSLAVSPITRPPQPGERSAEIGLLGQILLTFITAGAATALINCLRAYIERDRTLKIRLRRTDGTEFELEGKHFTPAAIDETIRALQRVVSA